MKRIGRGLYEEEKICLASFVWISCTLHIVRNCVLDFPRWPIFSSNVSLLLSVSNFYFCRFCFSVWLKSKKKYFLILFFGFSVLLYEYTTFGLSNMIQNGFQTIWIPSIFYFVFYSFLSFAGMVTGYYITKVKILSSKKK